MHTEMALGMAAGCTLSGRQPGQQANPYLRADCVPLYPPSSIHLLRVRHTEPVPPLEHKEGSGTLRQRQLRCTCRAACIDTASWQGTRPGTHHHNQELWRGSSCRPGCLGVVGVGSSAGSRALAAAALAPGIGTHFNCHPLLLHHLRYAPPLQSEKISLLLGHAGTASRTCRNSECARVVAGVQFQSAAPGEPWALCAAFPGGFGWPRDCEAQCAAHQWAKKAIFGALRASWRHAARRDGKRP